MRRYLEWRQEDGYPAGADIFYECLRCDEALPSVQAGVASCRCRNITFDIGRLDIEDHSKFRIFEADLQ